MRAWWAYWVTIAVAAVLWIGAPLIVGGDGLRALVRQPIWLAVLLLPLVIAGINLIVYRSSHEEVCRLEVERHPSLRYLVGQGYAARTFAWTGVVLLALVVVIVVSVFAGRL